MKPITQKQKEQVINEFFDTKKVVLYCADHNYGGKGMPTEGCPKCSKVFWQLLAASFPPEKRSQIIEELHEIVHKLVEEVEAGRFDINIYPHAKIEKIEKDKA